VFDSRVSGADAAMVPDGFDSKVQSTTSAGDLRDKAVRWMRQHSPAVLLTQRSTHNCSKRRLDGS